MREGVCEIKRDLGRLEGEEYIKGECDTSSHTVTGTRRIRDA